MTDDDPMPDCGIPGCYVAGSHALNHDPARRGEGAHECSHDFFAGVCRICGTPQPAAQEAERAWQDFSHADSERDPTFEECFKFGYRRGRTEEREANGKVLGALAFMKERDDLRAENARLREPFCMVTGFQSERGVCPEHRGDACLLMPVEFAKKLAATERERDDGETAFGEQNLRLTETLIALENTEDREKRLREALVGLLNECDSENCDACEFPINLHPSNAGCAWFDRVQEARAALAEGEK